MFFSPYDFFKLASYFNFSLFCVFLLLYNFIFILRGGSNDNVSTIENGLDRHWSLKQSVWFLLRVLKIPFEHSTISRYAQTVQILSGLLMCDYKFTKLARMGD